MNCNKCKEMLLSYLDNELNPLEIVSIEDHLSACSGCREELEVLVQTQGELRQAFKSMTAGVSPSPHALENIKHRIAAEKGHTAGMLSRWKERIRGGTGMLKSPRLKWQMVGTLIVGVALVLSLTIPSLSKDSPAAANGLTKFSSYDELKEFIEGSSQSDYGIKGDGSFFPTQDMDGIANAEDSDSGDYSETNIQVEGVDEADIVKTDGEFIYLVSEGRVIIARADPLDAQLLTEIDPGIEQDESIAGLYINGDRLVVIHQNWNYLEIYYEYDEDNEKLYVPESAEISPPQTHIKVYDVSDKENPVLARDMSIDGNYFNSRMIDDNIYLIVNASAYEQNGKIELPVIYPDDTGVNDIKINATDIYYTGITDYYYSFTTVVAVNIEEDDQDPEYETLLLGATSNMFVSLNNIYVTSTFWSDNSEKTAIHRIHTSDGNIEYEASGEAPGRLLNQFSMDEYQGFFRIATTTSGWGLGDVRTDVFSPEVSEGTSEIIPENTSANHMYILDMEHLNIAGRVENLAPGEQIYSTRFMGDKAYMVTFRQVDPLFVIDLTNPYEPAVLGELKITGYSDYLHPYDENYLIGIGKEATDTGLFQGVKISLFDVSDFDNPEEIAKFVIGDRGTESPVLDDHKALLFDKSRNLLVMPVMVSEGPYYYPAWQGAYVFHISPEEGLILRGKITHIQDEGDLDSLYYQSDSFIERSLYIDGVLYTISDTKIGINDLLTLDEIGEIILP